MATLDPNGDQLEFSPKKRDKAAGISVFAAAFLVVWELLFVQEFGAPSLLKFLFS